MNYRHIIAALVLLNIACVVYIATTRSRVPPSELNSRRFQTRPREAAPTLSAARTNLVVQTNRFEWAQLEAEDYREYISRLRSVGCPEETIRDIVIADLEKLMAARVQEIEGRKEPPKYWKSEAREMVRTLESLDKLTRKDEVDFEKREIVRELLGIDLAAERLRQKGQSDMYQERLGFLPEEKLSRVRTIIERANREEIFLREKSWLEGDELTVEEQLRLREIQRHKEASITALLSPEEKAKYDLWFSQSAYRARDALMTMDNTEHEFLAVYEAQKELDAAWGGVDVESLKAEDRDSYNRAREEYDEKIRDSLGDERYEQFVRAQDNDFRQLAITAAQFELPREAAEEVYNFKAIVAEQRAAVRADAVLSEPEKIELLGSIAAETERAVIEVVGPKAYRYYLRTGAGKWILE